MANKKRSVRSLITNNLGLKLISLLFALLLWSFVTNSTNPDRTKTITDVKIEIQGAEVLAEKGFSIRDDLSKLEPVDIEVKVKHADYSSVNADVVHAYIDVSEIARDGTHHVAIKPTFSNFVDATLLSIEPQESITLTVDKIIEKEVKVVLKETGTLKDGFIKVQPQYASTVTVKGSGFYLERIEKAIVEVDLSTLSDGDDKRSIICKYTDNDENIINFPGQAIDIDMDIQSTKEFSFNISDSVINKDKVLENYEFVSATAEKVFICAHKENLVNMSEITIQEIDLSGKDDTFTSAPIVFNFPEGISLMPGTEAPQATIKIKPQSHSIEVVRHINVSGLGAELNASITDGTNTAFISADGSAQIEAKVTLMGTKAVLDNIKDEDVIVRLSLLDKGIGKYELTPIVSLSPSIASDVKAELTSPLKVTVTINRNMSATVTRKLIISDLKSRLSATVTSGSQSSDIPADGITEIKASINLSGPKFLLETISEEDVIVHLSLKDMGAGTYELTPVVGLKPELNDSIKAQLISPSKVTVSITQN